MYVCIHIYIYAASRKCLEPCVSLSPRAQHQSSSVQSQPSPSTRKNQLDIVRGRSERISEFEADSRRWQVRSKEWSIFWVSFWCTPLSIYTSLLTSLLFHVPQQGGQSYLVGLLLVYPSIWRPPLFGALENKVVNRIGLFSVLHTPLFGFIQISF